MIGFKREGFTIVELLIAIVVVTILAAIVIVAYSGIQASARDAKRQSDIEQLAKLLEIYYVEKGYYPPFSLSSGTVGINSASWRVANIPNVKEGILTPPGASATSLVNSTTPSKTQYGYHNAGTCGGTPKCSKVRLYWRSESGEVHVVMGGTG